jgi:hypothetical protein
MRWQDAQCNMMQVLMRFDAAVLPAVYIATA